MRYRRLGNSDIEVSAVGVGCWGMGGYYSEDRTHDHSHLHVIEEALELGITHFDTAELYGAGHSEEILAKGLGKKRLEVVIASKVSPENLSYKDVLSSAERSLKRLNTDYIDLYYIHWPNPAIPLEETIRAFVQLKDQGKIRLIGLSNFSPRELQKAQSLLGDEEIAACQDEYNLFDISIEERLRPLCEENRISTIAYSPLDRGRILGNPQLVEIAAVHNAGPAQVALQWLLCRGNVLVIPKAGSVEHLRENALAAELLLADEEVEMLAHIFDASRVQLPAAEIEVELEGIENFTPSPKVLAEVVRKNESIKPVRVKRLHGEGAKRYSLLEGKLRFCAWCIAFDGARDVPALVRTEEI